MTNGAGLIITRLRFEFVVKTVFNLSPDFLYGTKFSVQEIVPTCQPKTENSHTFLGTFVSLSQVQFNPFKNTGNNALASILQRRMSCFA